MLQGREHYGVDFIFGASHANPTAYYYSALGYKICIITVFIQNSYARTDSELSQESLTKKTMGIVPFSQNSLTITLLRKIVRILFEGKRMGKLIFLCFVLGFLGCSLILASQLNPALGGQVIGTSSSITVALLGFWICFRKSKP